jgi:hypothetical protein
VNHPPLVKTSDQPSFCSSNFSPFIFADAVRSIIRYQPCAKPELNPSPRGGTAKKITTSHYENILRQLRKRKSNRPLNPKPDGLRLMLFLVLQKDKTEEKGLPGSTSG